MPWTRIEERYREEDRGYDTPCWIWLLRKNNKGYGQIGGGRAGHTLAHRATYEEARGPIPEGLVLDHLCRQPACVNPDHLEPVTQKVNCERAIGAGRPAVISGATRFLMAWTEQTTTLRRGEIADLCEVSPSTVTRLLGSSRKAAA